MLSLEFCNIFLTNSVQLLKVTVISYCLFEPRHAIMCLREINYVMRYDVVKSDVHL